MIYKRFKNPHIKLWNNELERLFNFKSLPKNQREDNSTDKGKLVENVDDLAIGHLQDIMNQKILMPIAKLIEPGKDHQNPVLQNKPISIETALIWGESDRFYSIVDPEADQSEIQHELETEPENREVVGLHVINKIQYDNDDCSLILFRNWTHNFRYQFAKAESQL